MAGLCKFVGSLLTLAGIGAAVFFVVVMARDVNYRRAALAASLNKGNVMYEAEFKGAQARRAFELVGTMGGVLLAINGLTLFGLGVVAKRVSRRP